MSGSFGQGDICWFLFQDLSTDQIEDLLRTLEYEEEYRLD